MKKFKKLLLKIVPGLTVLCLLLGGIGVIAYNNNAFETTETHAATNSKVKITGLKYSNAVAKYNWNHGRWEARAKLSWNKVPDTGIYYEYLSPDGIIRPAGRDTSSCYITETHSWIRPTFAQYYVRAKLRDGSYTPWTSIWVHFK